MTVFERALVVVFAPSYIALAVCVLRAQDDPHDQEYGATPSGSTTSASGERTGSDRAVQWRGGGPRV